MFSASKTAGPSGYAIQRSVRLRSSASAYFNRTPASATNRKTWTYSGWVKRGALGANLSVMGAQAASTAGTQRFNMYFDTNNCLNVVDDQINISSNLQFITTQVFRDPSAWYHVVLAMDTTQATSTNRVKLYVNGVQVTAFSTSTYPSLNFDTAINNNVAQYLGYYNNLGTTIFYYDGYETEINLIDGQALTPTSFGAYNATTGVWQPIKYTGTYGTNGFYLNFQDNSAATAAAIGKDSSGNGNNWTPNNISVTAGVTYDSMTDVPTLTSATQANFSVLNAVSAYSGLPISAANLQTTAVPSGANWFSRSTTMGISTGKIYAEFSMPSITSGAQGNPVGFGIMPSSVDFSAIGQQIGGSGFGYGFYCPDTAGTSPKKIVAGTTTAVGTGTATTTTDIFMVAFDLTNGNGWFGKNGTWYAGDPSAGTGASITGITAGEYIFGLSVYRDGTYTNNTAAINFGQRPFSYTPPTGYNRLCTYNLATPTIPNGAAQMAATTYTGTGVAQNISNSVNGISFKPDLVWVKARSFAYSHRLANSITGATNYLDSAQTAAEFTDAGNSISSFNSNGFGVGTYVSANNNTTTYVGWQWKASNATAVTNTAGSITSSVSANQTAGFSIVTYTGTGANATVGHGLGVAPKMMIFKGRNVVSDWVVYHASIGNTGALSLNQTIATSTSINYWNNTSPTSSVFTIGIAGGVNNSSSNTYVAYCFAEIAGFSKFGSYTGNGSADGPFVYCGFRPRWVMVKLTTAAGYDWVILDTSRNTYNVMQTGLQANSTAADNSTSSYYIDTLSNGFKLRNAYAGLNGSGSTYIYAAFAENPFNYSLAR